MKSHPSHIAREFDVRFLFNVPRLERRINGMLPSWLRPVVSTDDIVQEVWIAASTGWSSRRWRCDGSLEKWLERIAERTVRNAVKRESRLKRGGLTKRHWLPVDRRIAVALNRRAARSARSSVHLAITSEFVQGVRQVLQDLPPRQRKVTWLRYIDGIGPRAIAAELGASEAAVLGLLFRARQSLRRQPVASRLYAACSEES